MNPTKRHHPDPAAAAAMAAMHEHQMAAMFAANAASMAPMHALPGLAQAPPVPEGPGPHLKDEKVEVRHLAALMMLGKTARRITLEMYPVSPRLRCSAFC